MTNDIVKNYVVEINGLHREVFGSVKMTLDKAIRIGELLTQCKADIPHGEWLQWMRINLDFSDRTAQVYIRVYKTAGSADLGSISKVLLDHKPQKKQEVKVEPPGTDEIVEVEVVAEPGGAITPPPESPKEIIKSKKNKKKLPPPSNGMQFARLAIMDLEKITEDDTDRSIAFERVLNWIIPKIEEIQEKKQEEAIAKHKARREELKPLFEKADHLYDDPDSTKELTEEEDSTLEEFYKEDNKIEADDVYRYFSNNWQQLPIRRKREFLRCYVSEELRKKAPYGGQRYS